MKTKETHNPGERACADAARGRLQGGKRRTNKKGPGGQRNPLIRLNSPMESQGFSLAGFWPILLDDPDLAGFAFGLENVGFNSRTRMGLRLPHFSGNPALRRPSMMRSVCAL